MNTQPGTQLVFPWMNGYTVQNALQSIKQVPDPLPPWDERSNEPHPEVIGLRVLSVVKVK